jgi:hypothetical protein
MGRAQIEQVKAWIREVGDLPPSADLVVAELPPPPHDPSVAVVVISAMLDSGGMRQCRVPRRLDQLTQQDVEAAWSADASVWISLATE